MADNKTQWVFDLDIKDATEKILNLQGKVSSLGSEENVKGLIEGLMKVGVAAGLLGTAFFALKTTMDVVFEGENIKAINNQFEMLTKNAGVAGEAIKEGMTKAAGGLIDDTDLIQAANKALVSMGSTAKDLPAVMDIARKSTAVFGGDLKNNFEAINQAIASGQTRMLKSMGIVIDSEKAYQHYAKSIGATVSTLNEAGKQQAIMNAVLEKGNSSLAGVDVNLKKNQNAFQEIKVLLGQIHESFVIFFEKTMGPILVKVLTQLKGLIGGVKDDVVAMNSAWGENTEATNAQLKSLNKDLEKQKELLDNLNKARGAIDPTIYERTKKQYEIQIIAIEGEINGLEQVKKKHEEVAEAQAKAAEQASKQGPSKGIDPELAAKQQAAFEKSLEEMNVKRVEMEEKNATDIETVDVLHNEKRLAIVSEFEARKNAIAQSKEFTPEQKLLLEEQLEQQKNATIISLDDQLDKKRQDALDRFAERNKNTAAGFSAAWASETKKAVDANKNFSTLGSIAFNSLNKNAAGMFRAMGDGSKSAGEAMKGFLFGSIADVADAKGQFLLASGIGTMNPIEIAQGGALLALAGLLRSQAGGSAGGVSAGAGGGSVGGGPGAGASVTESKPEVKEAKKAVTVQVMGSYFETEQTKTRLMEMIRESSDATDFSFKQIGQ